MCVNFLGLGRHVDRESRRKKELEGAPVSVDMTLQSKDISVRIVHAGGQEELYQDVVPASQLMEKYPGMCVARPEVFKNADDSLLWPEENLLPGQKYFIIPSTTVQKLKCKQQQKVKVNGSTGGIEDMSDARITWDVSEENLEESVYSAKEFYVSKERSSRLRTRRGGRIKKPFVPPLPKARACPGVGWEPSLTSVQEISP